jgi:hypothetical protein
MGEFIVSNSALFSRDDRFRRLARPKAFEVGVRSSAGGLASLSHPLPDLETLRGIVLFLTILLGKIRLSFAAFHFIRGCRVNRVFVHEPQSSVLWTFLEYTRTPF